MSVYLETVFLEPIEIRLKRWHKETMGDPTLGAILLKLEEEYSELLEAVALAKTPQQIGEEMADVYIVMVGALSRHFKIDFTAALEEKYLKNVRRTWEKLPNGIHRHVGED